MFSTSSQRKHWIFNSEQELAKLRQECNRKFIEKQRQRKPGEINEDNFLTVAEERILCKKYELFLKDFCRKFQPVMPKAVVGTSFNYFKRFYLYNSVMDYHPKELLVTCVYLACKVEEFNVSIMQFVANVNGNRDKAMDIILNNELLLMQQLNYHLTVHNPYRPVDGFLLDIRTRYRAISSISRLQPTIDDFLERCLFTDACLLYSPSQIALTAIVYAATKVQENVTDYVTEVLLKTNGQDKLPRLIEILKKIRNLVKAIEFPSKEQLKAIEKKLDTCRNQENNPDSQIYKAKMQERSKADKDRSAEKYSRITEEQRLADEELVGRPQTSHHND